MKPYLYCGAHFMWNLDCSVGKGGANAIATDVSFIQWYYTLAANFHLTDAGRKVIYRKVKITGACNGTDNDPLVAAIMAQQRSINHPQVDGKVSVITGTGKIGASAFFPLRLEARFARMHPNVWPRLDLIPNCPGSIQQLARAAVPSTNQFTPQ